LKEEIKANTKFRIGPVFINNCPDVLYMRARTHAHTRAL